MLRYKVKGGKVSEESRKDYNESSSEKESDA